MADLVFSFFNKTVSNWRLAPARTKMGYSLEHVTRRTYLKIFPPADVRLRPDPRIGTLSNFKLWLSFSERHHDSHNTSPNHIQWGRIRKRKSSKFVQQILQQLLASMLERYAWKTSFLPWKEWFRQCCFTKAFWLTSQIKSTNTYRKVFIYKRYLLHWLGTVAQCCRIWFWNLSTWKGLN